jgi:c-di-GMP-binding flagellar brake protein YcgR
MGRERRRPGHIRVPVRVPATAETTTSRPERERGETEDLSRGGLLLWLPKGLVPGAPVRVTIGLRQRSALTIEGTVVRVAPHRTLTGQAVGIRFDRELDRDTVADIADEEFPPWGRNVMQST